MRYIQVTEPGGPDVLRAVEGERPQPGPGEVLIRVVAAGVNRADIFQRRGAYPPPAGASPVLGLEVSGEIVECGAGVERWSPGDSVCALANGGGYAEYVAVPAGQCLPIPSGLPMVEAAALPETFFTVWNNVVERGELKPGEVLLVHGGSSGIGTTAIQLARARGARVFTTAGSDEKCGACEQLGAERAINYRREDFVEVVREHTGGHGADLILDMVGGDYTERNIRLAATGGRIVNIAALEGPQVNLNLGTIMAKRLTLTGSTLRPRSRAVKAAIAEALEREVWPAIAEGTIRPVIHATFPLDRAADAHRLMESSRHIGKIVLVASSR